MNIETFTRSILSKISLKGKCYDDFFVHLISLMLSLPNKYNFLAMSRYGGKSERTYRNHFSKPHEMASFNMALIKECSQNEIIWAFDPSYLSKSGKKTYGLGYFWSGCANSTKVGLEIASIAAVDIKQKRALHYKAIQTPAKLDNETPWEYYARIIIAEKEQLQQLSNISVLDAYFSKKTFVTPMVENGFEVISKLASNAKLRYLYAGLQKGNIGQNLGKGKGSGGGRPKKFDGKVKLKNLNPQYFTPCYQDDDEIGYEGVVYADALKRPIRLVVIHKMDTEGKVIGVRTEFSTNLNSIGIDIIYNYRMRFQQEFMFRDGKQYTGLNDCEARSMEKIDFHINASLTAVNVAKAVHHHPIENQETPFSMADIKTQYFNKLLLDETINIIISEFGIDPNAIKNNQQIALLYQKGKIAA